MLGLPDLSRLSLCTGTPELNADDSNETFDVTLSSPPSSSSLVILVGTCHATQGFLERLKLTLQHENLPHLTTYPPGFTRLEVNKFIDPSQYFGSNGRVSCNMRSFLVHQKIIQLVVQALTDPKKESDNVPFMFFDCNHAFSGHGAELTTHGVQDSQLPSFSYMQGTIAADSVTAPHLSVSYVGRFIREKMFVMNFHDSVGSDNWLFEEKKKPRHPVIIRWTGQSKKRKAGDERALKLACEGDVDEI